MERATADYAHHHRPAALPALASPRADGVAPPSRVLYYVERAVQARAHGRLAAGSEFSLVVDADGMVWASGSNARGQLGEREDDSEDGDVHDLATPRQFEVIVACGVRCIARCVARDLAPGMLLHPVVAIT